MIPSNKDFPRAAGLFGRIAGVPGRIRDWRDVPEGVSSPESYRQALLRKAVAFTTRGKYDQELQD